MGKNLDKSRNMSGSFASKEFIRRLTLFGEYLEFKSTEDAIENMQNHMSNVDRAKIKNWWNGTLIVDSFVPHLMEYYKKLVKEKKSIDIDVQKLESAFFGENKIFDKLIERESVFIFGNHYLVNSTSTKALKRISGLWSIYRLNNVSRELISEPIEIEHSSDKTGRCSFKEHKNETTYIGTVYGSGQNKAVAIFGAVTHQREYKVQTLIIDVDSEYDSEFAVIGTGFTYDNNVPIAFGGVMVKDNSESKHGVVDKSHPDYHRYLNIITTLKCSNLTISNQDIRSKVME